MGWILGSRKLYEAGKSAPFVADRLGPLLMHLVRAAKGVPLASRVVRVGKVAWGVLGRFRRAGGASPPVPGVGVRLLSWAARGAKLAVPAMQVVSLPPVPGVVARFLSRAARGAKLAGPAMQVVSLLAPGAGGVNVGFTLVSMLEPIAVHLWRRKASSAAACAACPRQAQLETQVTSSPGLYLQYLKFGLRRSFSRA